MSDEVRTSTGMKSIMQYGNMPLGKSIREYYSNSLKMDWIFDKWYEKAILLAMSFWSFYGIYLLFKLIQGGA